MATQAQHLTLWGRLSKAIALFNRINLGSAVMARTRRKREYLPVFRTVQSISGAHEKDVGKDPLWPYPEPSQVSLGEEPKACRVYTKRGN